MMNKHSTTCLFLFVAALLIEIYSCQQCSYDTNIDYFGNDLIAEPVFTNSSDGCCLYCAQNSKCQVWTWVPATKACWIKTNVGSRRFKSFGRASGVRQYVSGMNYAASGSYGNNNGYPSSGGSYGSYGNQGGGYGSNNMGYGSNNMGYGSYGSGSYGSGSYGSGSYATVSTTSAATITTAAAAAATTVTATTTTTSSIVVVTSTVAATLPGAPVGATIAPTTTTVATAVRSTICFIENNANYPGNDLVGQGNINDPGACCTLCGQTSGCVAWSYYKQFNYCFLKSAAPSSPGQPYPTMVSGKIVTPPSTSG